MSHMQKFHVTQTWYTNFNILAVEIFWFCCILPSTSLYSEGYAHYTYYYALQILRNIYQYNY